MKNMDIDLKMDVNDEHYILLETIRELYNSGLFKSESMSSHIIETVTMFLGKYYVYNQQKDFYQDRR